MNQKIPLLTGFPVADQELHDSLAAPKSAAYHLKMEKGVTGAVPAEFDFRSLMNADAARSICSSILSAL